MWRYWTSISSECSMSVRNTFGRRSPPSGRRSLGDRRCIGVVGLQWISRRRSLRWARAKGAKKVILAVPVAPGEAVRRLEGEADEIRPLATPEPFFAVGQWYGSFPQVSDERVIQLLSSSAGDSR